MSDPEKNNGWASPSVMLGILGMLAGAGGSYMAFDGRLSRVEVRVEEKALASDARLNRMESKIDKLIEVAGQ